MSKETIRIYYNPRCSKCRDTAAMVSDRGYASELIEYLVTPPGKEELRNLLKKLGIKPLQLVRQYSFLCDSSMKQMNEKLEN